MCIYRAYSLIIGSELPLPELPPAEGDPDIVIRLGQVPRVPRIATLTNERAMHNLAGTFELEHGRQITVDPLPGADPGMVRLILLGRMMAYLLRQRGWLSLHASGVSIDGQAILFLGISGSGKSTMAAGFYARGHRVLTDDVAPVRITDGQCVMLPARPRLRLDENSRPIMAVDAPGGTLEWDDKFRFDLPPDPSDEPITVSRIYVLADAEQIALEPMSSSDVVRHLSAHCFFRRRRMDTTAIAAHLRDCADVASLISVKHLMRPRRLPDIPMVVAAVEKDLAAVRFQGNRDG